jgi:ATP-dependent helicase HrpB
VLFEAVRDDLPRVLPGPETKARHFLVRLGCLAQWMPELELPIVNLEALTEILAELALSCRSLAQLRNADWLGEIQLRLGYQKVRLVETEAPERLQVPSGSQLQLKYELGRPPVLAVRIQEIFGLQETPRVAGGRVPVLLHLLAPNYRPQQVTNDLASFWINTYPQVRKDLRARYPKHAWPEDPLTASPERRPGRRSS